MGNAICLYVTPCLNVSTTPITTMECRQCLPCPAKRLTLLNMAFPVVEFQGRDTKLEMFLAKNQLYSNEITKFWKLE